MTPDTLKKSSAKQAAPVQDPDAGLIDHPIFVLPGHESPDAYVVTDLDAVVDKLIMIVPYISSTFSDLQMDPESSEPRIDPETQREYMTVPGIRGHIRRYLAAKFEATLYMTSGAALSEKVEKACSEQGMDLSVFTAAKGSSDDGDDDDSDDEEEEVAAAPRGKKKNGNGDKAKNGKRRMTDDDRGNAIRFVCGTYPDVSGFGAVLTAPVNRGITGPYQNSFLISVHPVEVLNIKLTRSAVANTKLKESRDRTFGSLSVAKFGLFKGFDTVSPYQAKVTGFTWRQLNRILDAYQNMWVLSKSCLRPDVRFERLDVFIHSSAYGSCPEKKIRKSVQVVRTDGGKADEPAKSMDDYDFEPHHDQLNDSIVHLVRE